MNESRLRVLVIDADPDRVQLLEEAFGEMEDLRYSRSSMPACRRDYALDWRDAIEQRDPRGAPPDAILLNISHDCLPSPSAAVAALRGAWPSAAVVLVAARHDESLAMGLIRMGAQDYLLEPEIDCAPLGRALRCAVERSRLAWSRQSIEMVDDLTGLYNARGVGLLAERDGRLAEALGLSPWSVELRLEAPGSADADLLRLEVAEQLNEWTATGLLAGRPSSDEFVLFGIAASAAAADACADEAASKLERACSARGIPVSVRAAAIC
jgi:DNA-binding NarL/FixJ family response regulator